MNETLTCSACNAECPAAWQGGNYIDNGWSFDWVDAGHYNGFTDHFMGEPDDPKDHLVHFCHDCCVKLLDMFPPLVEKMRCKGGHPNMNPSVKDDGIATPPCCPYAWTWVRDKSKLGYQNQFTTYLATSSLDWEISPND